MIARSVALVMLVATTSAAAADASPSPENRENVVTLSNRSGTSITNYEFQFARPFLPGEIPTNPKAVIAGASIATQANVLQRHPDGSVKHAVISVIIPSLPRDSLIEMQFADRPSGNTSPLTMAQMLAPDFDFDCVMRLAFATGIVATASAREMLAAGHYRVVYAGPIAQTVEIGDDTPARTYDIGDGDGFHPFRPRFYATFYPASHRVRVRWVGENGLSTELKDLRYSLTVTLGNSSPATVYSIDLTQGTNKKFHHTMSNVTGVHWIGGEPEQKININHNLQYLAATKFVPNFDTSIVVSEAALSSIFSFYNSRPKDLYDSGGIIAVNMGVAGSRSDIGPYPSWTVVWLYTGDYRARLYSFKSADLASAWPANLRETDPTRNFSRFDPPIPVGGVGTGYGRPVSHADRASWLSSRPSYSYIKAQDSVQVIVGSQTYNYSEFMYDKINQPQPRIEPIAPFDWKIDGAHQPSYFYPQYILSGDPYYLQLMYNWAMFCAAFPNGAASPLVNGRGPTGKEGVIRDQVRGVGWLIRNRAETTFALPDDHVAKPYLTELVIDALAEFEGARQINGTTLDGHPIKAWSSSVGDYWTMNGSPLSGQPPLLRQWESNGNPNFPSSTITNNEGAGHYQAGKVGSFDSIWMDHFNLYAFGRLVELGFPAGPLLENTGRLQTDIIVHSGHPKLIVDYQTPVEKRGGGWFTWEELISDAFTDWHLNEYIPQYFQGYQTADGRHVWATPGLAYMAKVTPDGAAAWQWWLQNVYDLVKPADVYPLGVLAYGFGRDPRWAIVPRQ
jgi:hypothetical protein